MSGVYAENSLSDLAAFEAGRGRQVDSVVVFPARDSQAALLDTWWLAPGQPVTGNGGYLTVTVPLWTADQTINTDTTTLFQGLATAIQNSGLASRTIVRLGWEMNISSWYWQVTPANRTQWVANFKRAVDLLRAGAPGVKIAFNPNEGGDATGVSIAQLATDLLAYYDWVGPDFYNWYQPVNTDSEWTSRYNLAVGGMKFWEDFARTNNKGFAIPEWGGWPGTQGVAGNGHLSDGALYARKMIQRFAALAAEGIPVMECYFNEEAAYIANSLWAPTQMPTLAAEYTAQLALQPTIP